MNPRQRSSFYHNYHRALLGCEAHAQKVIEDLLSKQQKAVLQSLRQNGLAETVAYLQSLLPNSDAQAAIESVYLQTARVFFGFAIKYAPKQKNAGGVLPSPLSIGFFDAVFIEKVRAFVAQQGAVQATGITETTRQRYNQILTDAIKDRLTVPQIAKQIKAVGVASQGRAVNIARTETTIAANFVQFETMREIGLPVNKIWISARDARTRDAHRSMEGKTVGFNEPFKVGGVDMMHPGDPRGGAKNVCNCRCTVAFVPAIESAAPVPQRNNSLLSIAAAISAIIASSE